MVSNISLLLLDEELNSSPMEEESMEHQKENKNKKTKKWINEKTQVRTRIKLKQGTKLGAKQRALCGLTSLCTK